MILRSLPTWQTADWQQELNNLIVDPQQLLQIVGLDMQWLAAAQESARLFPLRATHSFVARIKPGDPDDPLLRQILPLQEEQLAVPGYEDDPLAEQRFNPVPGIVHKYRNRVLLITATQCAINCRYCFRRHFPYSDNQLRRDQWQVALDYIKGDPHINEVILSGGDPLSVGDRQLQWLAGELANIAHVQRLRIHSRYPIILPGRITDALVAILTGTRLKPVLVIHCNHPQELDQTVSDALARLHRAGVTLLNQTVLLQGVNDDSDTLAALSEVLFRSNTLPYYLHLLDKVRGAAHFAVEDARARQLYQALLGKLPGYLVPKLVRELPDATSKTPIVPDINQFV